MLLQNRLTMAYPLATRAKRAPQRGERSALSAWSCQRTAGPLPGRQSSCEQGCLRKQASLLAGGEQAPTSTREGGAPACPARRMPALGARLSEIRPMAVKRPAGARNGLLRPSGNLRLVCGDPVVRLGLRPGSASSETPRFSLVGSQQRDSLLLVH